MMPTGDKVGISTRAFESLPNLRLLQISNVNLIGSFENIFEELRWFCWYACSLECLPSSFQAPKLVFLEMQPSSVSILWEGTKVCICSLPSLSFSSNMYIVISLFGSMFDEKYSVIANFIKFF